MPSSTETENNPVTPGLKFDGSVNLGNLISLALLLLALVGAWHALDTKITVLELQAVDAKADHATLETLKAIIGNKIPDTLPMLLNTKSQTSVVHTFGQKMFEAGVAADAAEMPRGPGAPVPTAPVPAEKK
jgi:hypothetical protein